ncbi:hypothetical protein EXIGLDRAFT_484288 [Exidia glandulosa HHB12029]|uniref:F-box domain-containing protein n=1 Tax=Exidia glandulosa HHB12029 TaxID=1314781 RepID=A0A165PJU3_EXIGL|nr:hypothetical protein EXIGLDRAFT_484288 [Exidia glandulosa HHB12029]
MDSTSVLPPELLQGVFDHIGLSDVIRASHVSQRWRVLACQHPTYCRRVVLHETAEQPSKSSLVERAIAQLTLGSTAPIDVDVVRYFPASELVAQCDRDFLRVLVDNFHRVGTLALHVLGRECDAAALYATLFRQVLDTRASTAHTQLRRLTLTNVALPDETTVFERVVSLRYGGQHMHDVRITVDWLFTTFPALEELDVTDVELDTSTVSDDIGSWLSRLRYLRLNVPSSPDFLALPSVAHIMHVAVVNPTAADAVTIVSHIGDGQVDVALAEVDEARRCQKLTLIWRLNGIIRDLEFRNFVWLPDVPNLAPLSYHVSTLSLPLSDWDEAVQAFPHLVTLRCLTLILNETLQSELDTVLHAPSVRDLFLLGSNDYHEPVDGLALERFLRAFNPSCKSRIHLRLDGVLMKGWSDGLLELLENGAELKSKWAQ